MEPVTHSLYVDDFAGGGKNKQEVEELRTKLANRFNEGRFLMRKWKTNDPELRKTIQDEIKNDEKLCWHPEQQEKNHSQTRYLG